jgi:hypothetical protein
MVDRTDKRTHAQRRRMESQEAIRRKLRAAQYIRRLKEIAEKAEQAEASTIPALRLQADIYSRLLAKCLPDLKAIEHTGSITREPTRDELIERLTQLHARAIAGTQQRRADGAGATDGATEVHH